MLRHYDDLLVVIVLSYEAFLTKMEFVLSSTTTSAPIDTTACADKLSLDGGTDTVDNEAFAGLSGFDGNSADVLCIQVCDCSCCHLTLKFQYNKHEL